MGFGVRGQHSVYEEGRARRGKGFEDGLLFVSMCWSYGMRQDHGWCYRVFIVFSRQGGQGFRLE